MAERKVSEVTPETGAPPLTTPHATEINRGLSDERFAYEVVRSLGDSIRSLNLNVTALQTSNKEILEKVSIMEAQGLLERLAKLELRLDVIERDELKAKGVKDAISWFFQSPFVMWLMGILVAIYVWAEGHIGKGS